MAIEDGVFNLLAQNAGVTALVGTSPSRIYPIQAPQTPQYPYLVYLFVSEQVASAMGVDIGIVTRRLQIDCYDLTATGAQKLGDAVTTALARFRGTVSWTGGSQLIYECGRIGVNDLFDFEARKFKRVVDFEIIFNG